MLQIAHFLTSICNVIGRCAAWLTLALVLVQFAVVALRYGAGWNSIAVQESITYMHALVFLLAAAWTLQHEGHVRVDIFYGRCTPKRKALIDLLGTLFLLLPTCGFILYISFDYVAESWRIGEASRESGGLAWVWLLKTAIVAMAVLLLMQGVANVLTNAHKLLDSADE